MRSISKMEDTSHLHLLSARILKIAFSALKRNYRSLRRKSMRLLKEAQPVFKKNCGSQDLEEENVKFANKSMKTICNISNNLVM